MIRGLLFAIPVIFSVSASSVLAQSSSSSANPQNPSLLGVQSGFDPSGGVGGASAASLSSPSVLQGVGIIPSSTKPGTLGSAGRGLPGMPGGPSVKGILGYQDPSSAYMRPPTIGLSCAIP